MVKKSSKQTSLLLENDLLTLDYTLAELPSSQHRSGLAGLVLMVRWLHRFDAWKQDGSAICEIKNLSDRSVTLRVNQLGLQALFNEVYAASWEEKTEYKQRKDDITGEIIQPIKTEEVPDKDVKTGKVKIDKKTGQPRTKTAYYYPMFVPKGAFLVDQQYDHSSDGKKGIWIKLWRDALWAILKAKPLSRNSFKFRANSSSDTKDLDDVWKNLSDPVSPVKLAGSFYLGVQEKNADNIPFKDRGKFQFLLHFWFFIAPIYVPIKVKVDKSKETKKFEESIDFWGYAVAVPDIVNLKLFCNEFLEFLASREVKPFKFLPRESIIDLQLEAALDMSKRLETSLKKRESENNISDLVAGIDVIHAHRPGDDVKFIHFGRFLPTREMIDEYEVIKNSLWSPTFRRQRLLNLVNGKAWYIGFDLLLCTIPYEQAMENDYFRHDARESFKFETGETNMDSEIVNSTEDSDLPEYSCQRLVLRLVKIYVSRKLKSKHDLEWKKEWDLLTKTKEGRDELNKRNDYKEFSEKKSKIAKNAFLGVRSRTEKMDFINYFVETLCSVPQYMKEDFFVQLTHDLYEDHEKVRTLTMLALSANS